MPLEPTGVEFISKGFDDFIRNIGEAAKTISSLGRMTENRLAALRELNNLMATAGEEATKFSKSIGGTSETMNDNTNATNRTTESLLQFGATLAGIGAVAERTGSKIFKGMASAMAIGGMIGGALGTLAGPGVGNIIGGAIGALAGGWLQLQINISKALGNLFTSIIGTVSKFLGKTVHSIYKAGMDIGKAIWDFGKNVITTIGKIISAIASPIKKLAEAILGIFSFGDSGRRGGWRSLGDTIFSAMFKFEILKQVIRGIINEIKGLAKASFEAAVDLQTLTVRIDNLIAMQVRQAGITDDYDKSIRIATGHTQALLKWIQQMALATPISLEDVSHVASLTIAMGWSVDAAKTLTKAILDYTAATGLGSEISERIIYNFAQMKQQGKVTGTELRDLGRGAFMPINTILDIMAKDLGIATEGLEAFREQAASGSVDVNKFFDAFIEFVNVNMPDAAYRMNFTFFAVRQNIKDLFDVLMGWNVLGPLIKSITEPMQNFINRMRSDEVLAKANAIGKALAFLLNAIRTGFSKISEAMGSVFKAMGLVAPSIENVVLSILKLGMAIRYILTSIAGLIKGLVPFANQIHGVIGKTLDDMGNAAVTSTNDTRDKLNKTFSEMSSDFFTWGARLVVNFAKGMVQAAAKVLTQAMQIIAKILTSWLSPHSPPKILPEIDKWGMETINEWLHGFTQADFDILEDLQSTTKSALDALVAFSIFTEEQASKEYLNISIDLIRAMDELNSTGSITVDVFKRLREIGGVYGKEITELMDLQMQHLVILKAYNEAVKNRERLEVRTNKLIREYNTMLRKGADKKFLKNQLKVVNASELELDVARKAEIEKKNQLTLIEEQVKLQESLIKQLVELAQAQKEAAGGAAGAAEEITKAVNDLASQLGGIGGGFEIDFESLLNQAAKEWNKFLNQELPDLWDNAWNRNFVDPNSGFQKALGSMKTAWAAAWDEMAKVVHLPTWDEITRAWNAPIGGAGLQRGRDKRQPSEGKTLVQRFQDVIQAFSTSIQAEGGVGAILGNIAGFIWNKLVDKISTWWEENQETVKGKLNAAFGQMMTLIADAVTGEDTGEKGVAKGTPMERIGKKLIESLISGMLTAITEFDWKVELWKLINDTLIDFFQIAQDVSALFKGNGTTLIDSLAEGMVSLVIKYDWAKNIWQVIVDKARSFFGLDRPLEESKFYQIGKAIIDSIVAGINAAKANLQTLISEIAASLPTWLRKLLKMESPSKVFASIGEDMILGLEQGITKSMGNVRSALAGTVGEYATRSAISMNAPMQASPYGGKSVEFGDVYITDGAMSWAQFKAQVQRAIVEG